MATEKKVEEIITEVEKTKVEISPIVEIEKKYTEDEVSAIVAKRVNKEKAKTEEAKKKVLTLEERVLAIEEDKATEQAKKEIGEKLLMEEQTAFREITVNTIISDKVNDNYIENVKILVKGSINKDSTPEEIEIAIDAVISSLPDGVSKGSSNGSTQIRQKEITPPVTKTEKEEGIIMSHSGKKYKEEELNPVQAELLRNLN